MIYGIIPNNTTPDMRPYLGPATLGSKYALSAPINMTAQSRVKTIAIRLTLFDFFIWTYKKIIFRFCYPYLHIGIAPIPIIVDTKSQSS